MKAVITNAVVDEWEANRNNQKSFPNPSAEFIGSMVHSLDGKKHTLICLRFSDNSSVLIGGGNDDVFVITLEKNNCFFVMCNEHLPSTDRVEVVCGGQAGDFPRNQVVARTELEKRLRPLIDGGVAIPPYSWVRTS